MPSKNIEAKVENGGEYESLSFKSSTNAIMYDDTTTLSEKLYQLRNAFFPYKYKKNTETYPLGALEVNDMCPCGDGFIMVGNGFIKYSWDGLQWEDIGGATSIIASGNWVSCACDLEIGGPCVAIRGDIPLARSPFKKPWYMPWDERTQLNTDGNIIIIPRLMNRSGVTPIAYSHNMQYGLGGRPPCASKTEGVADPVAPEYMKQIIMQDGKAIIVTDTGALTYSEVTEVNGYKYYEEFMKRDGEFVYVTENIKTDAMVQSELRNGMAYTMWHYPIKQWPKSEAECWYRRWQLIYTGDKPDYEKWPFKPGDHNYRWFRTTLGSIAGKKPDNTRYKYISANPAFIDNTGMAAIPVVMCATNGKIKIFNFGTTYRDDPEGKLDMFDDDIFREYMYTTDFTAQFKPVKRPLPRIDSRNPEARDNSAFYMHSDGGPVLIKMSTNASKFAVTQMQFNGEFIDIYEVIHNGFGYIFATNKGIFFNREFVGSDVTSYNSFKWYNMPTYPECSADVKMTCNGSKVVIYDPTWECTMTIEPPNGEV